MRSVGPGEAPADPAARVAVGLSARRDVPLEAHAELPADGRPDPVAVLEVQAATRGPELVPIRYGRMLLSPFTFFRGAAAIMAADLARTSNCGLTVQLCGDAHLSNYGVFASPERRLVFDINDFDETYPGPWEFDLKRLAASLVVAARENGFGRKDRAAVVSATVSKYREAMSLFATQRHLDVWYAHADVDELMPFLKNQISRADLKRLSGVEAKARTRDSAHAFRKMTTVVDGRRLIAADAPLIVPLRDLLPGADSARLEAESQKIIAGYAASLAADRRHLVGGFQFVDVARKVVGVGSVGTQCWIVLLSGRDQDDPLLLQVKEAPPSVLAPHLAAPAQPAWGSEGERVVSGQRLMQAASDIFLGWYTFAGVDGTRDFYVRQLRDWKGSAVVETMAPKAMRAYGTACGWTLARAHARTGDRIAIGAYLKNGAAFDRVLGEFAERYADLNERDYQALVAAAKSGRIKVRSGV